MSNGDIVATIFNQPCHGKWEGDVDCWASSDGGKFWSYRGTPAPHEPGTNRMNVAAGLAGNGDFIVLCSGWGGDNFRGHVLPCWVCRSTDAGVTWEHSENLTCDGEHPPVPFGDIVQLTDELLGVTCYFRKAGTFFVRSRDDGRTWNEPTLISETNNETDLLLLDNGDLIAAARSQKGGHLDLFRSTDHGDTWTFDQQLTGPSMHPAHLQHLTNGHVLLGYGIRHRGCYGVGARVSDDNGQNWYSPALLCSLDDAVDGGYPASVQLADNTIVTVFYASGVGRHTRYHMGVVRWQFDEPFSQNR